MPTLASLANADDELLHKLWEGLGYYSRVRNLKKAAQMVMELHGGIFPHTFDEVLSLAGIGEYTAGAVCSICYDLPTPAVDGNVLRVISRITDDKTPIDKPAYKKQVTHALAAVYPAEAGAFTQALMELGATICGPNRPPECEICPCKDICLGFQRGTAHALPVKTPKRARRIEEKTVFILSCDGFYALEKRPTSGLLAGLWQFPNTDGMLDINGAVNAVEQNGLKPKEILRTVERKHTFTHVEWHMSGVYMEVTDKAGAYNWLSSEEIDSNAALPTAFRQFWEELKNV